ncbi:hypothetical protein DFH11DRAFT_133387 [Phellopilus nigrolimitatus]|nr:hypothetical protein DFH11DRAFT_133387 [Phellopilus nigrolimitatus]
MKSFPSQSPHFTSKRPAITHPLATRLMPQQNRENMTGSMSRAHHYFNIPQNILNDHVKLGWCPLDFGVKLAYIAVQMSDRTVPGISVYDAKHLHQLVKIVNNRQPLYPLVVRDEIRVCVNWPGYSHVTTTYQTLQIPVLVSSTLAELVSQVANQVGKYIEDCSRCEISADAQRYKIDRCYNLAYLYIIGFTNTFDGVWQVDLNARV